MFSASKNGVSACELERQLGTTYKCAWRMANHIRKLMKQDKGLLSGVVEVDETYWGGQRKQDIRMSNKSAIMGMVERQGRVRVKRIPNRETHILLNNIKGNINRDSSVMTDDWGAYKKIYKLGYKRSVVKHSKRRYVSGNIHTNTIEGWWSQFKRSIHGSYHSVSRKYLQSYLDEFAFRYNLRNDEISVFQWLLYRMVK